MQEKWNILYPIAPYLLYFHIYYAKTTTGKVRVNVTLRRVHIIIVGSENQYAECVF